MAGFAQAMAGKPAKASRSGFDEAVGQDVLQGSSE